MFLPHFDVYIHLLLKRRMVTWNLYSCFYFTKNQKNIVDDAIYASIHPTTDYKTKEIKLRKKLIFFIESYCVVVRICYNIVSRI